MKEQLYGESRRAFYGTIAGTWAIIACYAILHDQYLLRIAPEHFTVYHPNPHHIQNEYLLVFYLAFLASVSPGLVLGTMLYVVGRFGRRPRVEVRALLGSVVRLVVITEVIALISLAITMITRQKLYPEVMYPEDTFRLVISQTVQLTTYLAGAVGGVVLLFLTWRKRVALT